MLTKGDSTLDYGFSLVLKVRPPSLSVESWTRAFRKKPGRDWKVGEQRTTPTGRKLEGVYKNSYGFWDLTKGRGDVLVAFGEGKLLRVTPAGETTRVIDATGPGLQFGDIAYVPGKRLLVVPRVYYGSVAAYTVPE